MVPDLFREDDAKRARVCRESHLAPQRLQALEALHPHLMHGRDCIIRASPYVDFAAMKAIFVTTNEHKRREVQTILGVELEGAALGDRDVPEVQSLDFDEVSTAKALAAREALGRPTVPCSSRTRGSWSGRGTACRVR
jgi:hypothetical protein